LKTIYFVAFHNKQEREKHQKKDNSVVFCLSEKRKKERKKETLFKYEEEE